jgi:hypothetical protein
MQHINLPFGMIAVALLFQGDPCIVAEGAAERFLEEIHHRQAQLLPAFECGSHSPKRSYRS